MKKKRSERRKHCALAVVRRSQKFSPRRRVQTPFPGVQEGQHLISWRWSLPLPTDPVWWKSMHAITSYRGNRHTHKLTKPQTHKPTHRQNRLQYTAPQLARSVTILSYRPQVWLQHYTQCVRWITALVGKWQTKYLTQKNAIFCDWVQRIRKLK